MRVFTYIVFLSSCFVSAVPLFSQSLSENKASAAFTGISQLCGINSLWLALQILEQPVDHAALLDAFPDVRRDGVSLSQIKDFLENRKLFCQFSYMNESEIAKQPPKSLFFVLTRERTNGHIFLARPSRGGIQILDRDFIEPVRTIKSFTNKEKFLCLAVSTQPIAEKFSFLNLGYVVAALLFIGAAFLFFLAIKTKKEKIPHEQK